MTQGHMPLRRRALFLLIDAGTWVPRTDFDGLSSCVPAVDDALSDLVIDGQAEYRKDVGYRLAGDPLARQALQRLHRTPGLRRVAMGRESEKGLHLGVAERRDGVGAVHYALDMPPLEDLSQQVSRLQAVMDTFNK